MSKLLTVFIIFLSLLFSSFAPSVLAADTYQYDWTKAVGGSGADLGQSVITDPSGNVYITGYFNP